MINVLVASQQIYTHLGNLIIIVAITTRDALWGTTVQSASDCVLNSRCAMTVELREDGTEWYRFAIEPVAVDSRYCRELLWRYDATIYVSAIGKVMCVRNHVNALTDM